MNSTFTLVFLGVKMQLMKLHNSFNFPINPFSEVKGLHLINCWKPYMRNSWSVCWVWSSLQLREMETMADILSTVANMIDMSWTVGLFLPEPLLLRPCSYLAITSVLSDPVTSGQLSSPDVNAPKKDWGHTEIQSFKPHSEVVLNPTLPMVGKVF